MNHVQMKLNYFANIRCFLNNEAALLIYKTTILPLIEYADYIIDQHIKYVNNQLQNLQNRGLRIALNQHIKRYDERITTEEMHRAARIPTLYYRRELHLLQYAFDLKQKPGNVDDRMLPTRRHDGIRLITYTVKNRKYCRSIYYRASEKWNNLNVNLTLIDDKKVFKRLLLNSYENIYMLTLLMNRIYFYTYILYMRKFVCTCISMCVCVFVYMCI